MPTKQEYIDQHRVSRVELSNADALNPEADVADVIVHLQDGSRYRGTVTTLRFIEQTMERAQQEGDVEGDYWFGDAIIVSRIDEQKLGTIVADLIDSFVFEKAFQKVEAAAMS